MGKLKKAFEEKFNFTPESVIEPYWDWIVKEAKITELQKLWNELPLMSDLTTVSEKIYARIKELKQNS